ncbi:MAG: tRNA pseudouridine(38-40) synthase TruA [Ferruginibacter sp.]
MSRYFIEVAYKGTAYAGFQKQDNANTIQAELEKAMQTFYRVSFELTGSSRTDAGVHAAQNFFHFDTGDFETRDLNRDLYHLNAILPGDIVAKKMFKVKEDAHCRFDALWRQYQYTVYSSKNPFLADRAYFFPYNIDQACMQEAAALVISNTDFTAFSKKNTQVHNFNCAIYESEWVNTPDGCLVYRVRANRFLRGMVRALVATMLKTGTGKLPLEDFEAILHNKPGIIAAFDAPAQGLMLMEVGY